MYHPLPIGIENFEEIYSREFYYIDKTLLVKELMDKGAKVSLFTRPRRFGKTLTLSMLQYYFEDAYDVRGNKHSFDVIILGTGVRMGKIYKPASNFIRKNIEQLAQKKIAIFFCNAYSNTFDNAVEKNLPFELVQQAICIKSFGGKPPFSHPQNMNWLNKDNLNSFIATIHSL